MSSTRKIVAQNFCIGCGLCEDIGKASGYKMTLNETGFYTPIYDTINKEVESTINEICPGINVKAPKSNTIWGNVLSIYNAWAVDPIVRKKGSSGGVISAICIYLLESKTIDGVLQVGKNDNHYMYNSLHISRTKDDVLKNASSRYAPALVLHNISEILSETNEKFVFVGKPCDITAIKNYLERYPQYKSKIYYYISIFCAGIPSYNATEILLKNAEKETEPLCVKYRGDGWPGNFEAQYQDGYIFRKSYNESWGQVLGKNIHFRCKICPDGIGLFADIVAADSWETKDGYPDFEEKEGKSFVISRNAQGEELLKNAINSNYIKVEELNINDIKYIQPYQYRKRYEVGFRILGIQLCTFFSLRFLNFRLVSRMSQYNCLKGIKIVLGTIKRHIQKT